jgi:hypothetical protein
MIIRVFRPTVHPGKERAFKAFLRATAVALVAQQPGLVAQHVGKPRDPSSTEYVLEVVDALALADDLHRQGENLGGPGDQLAGVAGIGPYQPDGRQPAAKPPQQPAAAVAVLDAGGGDQDVQQQPVGVGGHVPPAAVDLRGGVVALAAREIQ